MDEKGEEKRPPGKPPIAVGEILESIRHLMLYGKRCKHSREERSGED